MSTTARKRQVLFVCHGNICRSPLAEGVFNHLAQQAGITDQVRAASAGVSAFHRGDPPDTRMSAVARENGIALAGQARQFGPADFARYDLIITMDRSNYDHVCHLANDRDEQERVQPFTAFDPTHNGDGDVPDPYYGGKKGFQQVFDIVMRSCTDMIARYHAGTLFPPPAAP